QIGPVEIIVDASEMGDELVGDVGRELGAAATDDGERHGGLAAGNAPIIVHGQRRRQAHRAGAARAH
ncbi:MAG: hypothetical protein ABSG83_15295, partial [Roseiarcus sp.]